jgi:hypothetical protein
LDNFTSAIYEEKSFGRTKYGHSDGYEIGWWIVVLSEGLVLQRSANKTCTTVYPVGL